MATFDAMPCFGSSLNDIDTRFITEDYLPQIIDKMELRTDKRTLEEQLSSIHLYDTSHNCLTNAAIILFAGEDTGTAILNERLIKGGLYTMLPKLESFVKDAIITARPLPVSMLREQIVYNYPELALRELLMNACMHRDYQSNMPIRIYQFSDRIEILNAGGLYGEARPENFPLVNDYRNPIIAEAMNMFNRGIQRVKVLLQENGNPEADFNVNKLTAFEVVIRPSLSLNLVTDGEKVTKLAVRSTAKMSEIIDFCKQPRTLTEVMEQLGLKHRNYIKTRYINPLIESGFLEMTSPDKPNSRNQKYKSILT